MKTPRSFRVIFSNLSWGALGTVLLVAPAARALPPVLETGHDGATPENEMRRFTLAATEAAGLRWSEAYEKRTDPKEIGARHARLRDQLLAAVGGRPERTPLNAQVTGTLAREGYRVEKIIFESRPRFYVTAALFLPDPARHPAPWPGVVVPCGHYDDAKAHDEYQAMGALLALNGMAGLVFDTLEQGERLQLIDAAGQARFTGSRAHSINDFKSILLGRGFAHYLVGDGMRAIDYLQSRPDINPQKIGVTGNSGGGLQTTLLLALDDRIGAAAPSCWVTNFAAQTRTSVGDGENNEFGLLAIGLDEADLLAMRAPTPVLVLAATHDTFDTAATWVTYRYAERTFTRLGFSERAAILENDAGHNYNRTQREGAARWMSRWLLNRDAVIVEPDLKLFTDEELHCTPGGQVMLLPDARSIHDLLREDADRAAADRRRHWAQLDTGQRRAAVRQIAGMPERPGLPTATWTGAWTQPGNGYRVEAWRVHTADGAVTIPALWLEPEHPVDEPGCVFVYEKGFADAAEADGPLAAMARTGRRVLAIDVRGTGETQQRHQMSGMPQANVGWDHWDRYALHLLGQSYVGLQAGDILSAASEMIRRTGRAQVDLFADGGVGVPALHAAFVEPATFRRLTLDGTLASWDEVARSNRIAYQAMNVVWNALSTYDLPDLVAELGAAVTIRNPGSALGRNLAKAGPPSAESLRPARAGLVGVRYELVKYVNPLGIEPWKGEDAEWIGRTGSERWSGFLIPDRSGRVTLAVESDQWISLRLGGREVATGRGPARRSEGVADLVAGEPLPLEVLFEKTKGAEKPANPASYLRLRWRDARGEWQTLPTSWLKHSLQQEIAAENTLQ